MLGLPEFLMSPRMRKAIREQEKREAKRRIANAVPWDPKMKWRKELNLKASTYFNISLFDVEPIQGPDIRVAEKQNLVLSPKGTFAYCEKILKKGTKLGCAYGNKKGSVIFDGPILIPSLHEKKTYGDKGWMCDPWMSTTPQEILTLRCGTRFAKGKTIIAGLGLGYQLIECSKRKQVKELVLVEKSQELVDWIMPAIEPMLEQKVEVVVADAYDVIPKMEANAALIDIYESYGGNEFPNCPGIDKVWCWGSQYAER